MVINNRQIPPEFTIPDYSTKLWLPYYYYIKKIYGESVFETICDNLNISSDYIKSTSNWISREFASKFINEVKRVTGDEDIARKVGETTLSSENINHFEFFLLKIMPAYVFFVSFPKQAEKVNNSDTYKIVRARPGKVHLKITSKADDEFFNDVCKNLQGTFDSLKSFYQLDSLSYNIKPGSSNLEQDVSINYKSVKSTNKRIFFLAAFIFIGYIITNFVEGIPYVANKLTMFVKIFAASSYVLLILNLAIFKKLFNLIFYNLLHNEEEKARSLKLYESNKKLDRRYQESNLLRDLSLKLVKLNSPKEVINSCLADLSKRFGYNRSMVMLIDSSESKLYTQEVMGFNLHSDMLHKLNFKYPATKDNPQIFAKILEAGETRLISDMKMFIDVLESENKVLLIALGLKSLIVSPIQDFKNKYGLLIVGVVEDERSLALEDKHLIENTTRMLSLFFQNAKNFEKERILRNMFQKYVPSIVIEGIKNLENGEQGFLTPRNNAVTSMFVDLRNFTSISENLVPEKVVEMLNLYTEFITAQIANQGGIVDNLVGDGVVAFFPANEDNRTLHSKQALFAAINILRNLSSLNKIMNEKGFPEARLGIGLHAGNATVGNVGSDRKMNYTAIGDTVNLASRLESISKDFIGKTKSSGQGMLIFSEAVLYRAMMDIPRLELGKVKVKGRADPVNIFMTDVEMAANLDLDKIQELDLKKDLILLDDNFNAIRRKTDKNKKAS